MSRTGLHGSAHPELLLKELQYRGPMLIEEVMVVDTPHGPDGYYVCPQCRSTLEREYMAFCDRCGQRLDWHNKRRAKIIHPGKKRQSP